MNRRNFFQLAAGTAAVALQDNAIERVSAAAASTNGRAPEDVATDEDFWIEVRNSFSIDRNIINFNNGYCSPSPRTVQDAMRRYLDYSDMGPWHTMVNVLVRAKSPVSVSSMPWRTTIPTTSPGCAPSAMRNPIS